MVNHLNYSDPIEFEADLRAHSHEMLRSPAIRSFNELTHQYQSLDDLTISMWFDISEIVRRVSLSLSLRVSSLVFLDNFTASSIFRGENLVKNGTIQLCEFC